MLDPGLVAYPALLAAIYGAFRVGRRRPLPPEGSFEWVRACSLAVLLGVLLAVQVRLIATGVVKTTPGIMAGSLGIAATVALVGLNIFEVFEARSERRPAPS
jgi:hypothetical protein